MPFSYTDIRKLTGDDIVDTYWHIVSDGTTKIGEIDFGGKIEKGGIVVQKSFDGSEWTTVYQNTNVFATYSSSIKNFYTASRADIANGCFYRITIAYKTERKTKDSKILWLIDNSEYDRKWHVEMYQIFLLSDDEAPEVITATPTGND